MEEAGILGNTALLNVVLPSCDPDPEMAVFGVYFERLSTGVHGQGWAPDISGSSRTPASASAQ
jgi:hypothetical protein